MTETVAVLAIGAAFVAALLFHASEVRAWRAERRDLLNRLMARKWEDYTVLAKEPQPDVARPDLSTNELEALWYEAHAREVTEAS